MKDWFDNLEKREQLFVSVGSVLVVFVIVWGLIWMPLDKGHQALRASVDDWQQSLAELRVIGASMQADSQPGGSNTPPVGGQSAVVIVDQTLRERNLNSSVKRRQPTPNGIRVEFENVAFDQLIVWLGDLNARYAMEVQAGSLTLSGRSDPGRINASITLERAP